MTKKLSEEELRFFATQVAERVTHYKSSEETKALIKGIEDKFTYLKEIVVEGFKTTHAKQDYTNGKVREHEKWINENKEFISDNKDERKFIKNKLIGKAIDLLFKLAPIGAVLYFIIVNK